MPDLLNDAPIFDGVTVLVTGGCGFIGSHLVESLANLGAKITVLDNLQAGKWDNLAHVPADKLRCETGDVRDADTVENLVAELRPRFIFHLAANASVPGSVNDPAYDFEANAVGTFRILEAVRKMDGGNGEGVCKKIVAASSGAVYGEPVSFPICETDDLVPISPYGASKLAGEISGRVFHKVYQSPVVLARIFNAYGPRMARFVMLDFLKKLKNDPARLEVLGTGQQVRDFTYVADTVQGLLRLAASGEAGQAYNLSSGISHSVTDLAHRLIEARGLAGQTEIAYTGTSWVGDAQRWEVDISKLKALGYAPQFALPDGLKHTAAWFDTAFGDGEESGY